MDAVAIRSLLLRALGGADRDAERILKELEVAEQGGFATTLLAIATSPSPADNTPADTDQRIRLLALIIFKNCIDRYWRRTATHALTVNEKTTIRTVLLNVVGKEESALFSKSYAESMAKIARIDFPQDWPNLIENLLSIVTSSFAVSSEDIRQSSIQQNALYTFHRVLKSLYSMKTMRSKVTLYQMTPHLFGPLTNLYLSSTSSIQPPDHPIESLPTVLSLKMARLALKCLRRLIVHGYPDKVTPSYGNAPPVHNNEHVVGFLRLLGNQLHSFLILRSKLLTSASDRELISIVNKMIVLIGKMFLEFQQERFIPFVHIPACLSVVKFYWECLQSYSNPGTSDCDNVYEVILLQGLKLFRNMIKNQELSAVLSQRHPDAPSASHILSTQVFTPEFVSTAATKLISVYLPLTSEELEQWEEEPESFVLEEEADQYEFSLRLCSQKAVADLMNQHRSILAPILISMLQQVQGISPASPPTDILLKTAVYTAISLTTYDLYDYMDFDTLFRNIWSHELTLTPATSSPTWRPIRYILSRLITSYIPVKSAPEIRPSLYASLIPLTTPQEDDLVIRLTAALSVLRILDEGIMTDGEAFRPFAPVCIESVMVLVETVEEFEMKARLLGGLKSVFYVLGGHGGQSHGVEEILPGIVSRLPGLWESSYDQMMLRTSILLMLAAMMTALKDRSMQLHGMIIPAIQFSIDPSVKINLFEDGIELWLSTLQNTLECTPELLSLFPVVEGLLEDGSEHLKIVLKIIESYFILAPGALIQEPITQKILQTLAGMISGLKLNAAKHILRTLFIITSSCYHQLPPQTRSTITHSLQSSGVFSTLVIESVRSIELGHVDHLVADFMGVLGLMCVWDVEGFGGGFDERLGGGQGLGALLDVWNRVFDAMTYAKQRKLAAMAMASLLATGHGIVISKAEEIFACVSSVLSEVHGKSDEERQVHWYQATSTDEWDLDEETPDRKRRSALQQSDPIYTTRLDQFVKTKLGDCERVCGGADAFREKVISVIDSAVVNELFKYLQ